MHLVSDPVQAPSLLWYYVYPRGDESSVGGLRAVKISQAKDQVRPVGGLRAASEVERARADDPVAPERAFASPAAGVIPLERSSRRWTVRVHWGIVFAIVASLVLWFAIKSIVALVL